MYSQNISEVHAAPEDITLSQNLDHQAPRPWVSQQALALPAWQPRKWRAWEPGKRSCEGAGGPVEPEGQVELASGKGSFPGAGF